MNELDNYHDRTAGQEIVSLEVPPTSDSEAASDLVGGILRRWYIALLIFFLMCGAGMPAIWLFLKPSYDVTGAIRVAPIQEDPLTGSQDPGDISDYERFVNTEAERVSSGTVIERVADRFVGRNMAFFDQESNLIGRLTQKLSGTKTRKEPATRLKEAIVDEKTIVIATDRNKELIKVMMKSEYAEEAKEIVDAFIRAYMDIAVVRNQEVENSQLAMLEAERDTLRDRIDNDRQMVYQLGQEFGSVALESRQEMMMNRVANLLTTLGGVEAQRIRLEAQVQLLERTKTQPIAPEELLRMRQSYINEDPAVVAFSANITQLEQELIVTKQTLSSTNPEVKRKTELLETLKKHLEERKLEASKTFDDLVAMEAAEAGRKQLESVRSELEQTLEYERRLNETLSQQDTQTIDVGRKQLTIQELQENLDSTKERYEVVLKRIQDLELQRKRPARISVYYSADIAAVNDRRIKLSAALVFGSLVCGMGLAFLRDKADQSLRTPADVSKRIGIRIIGTTTSLDTVKPALLPEQIVGDYQTIRANLGLIGGKGIPRKLIITSPGMKEGKTTFAVNLATSMAESGEKVLLIDGDLRKPDVARLLNLPKGSRGLQDVICGVKFEQAVYSMASTGLDVLAADFSNTTDAYELLAMPTTAQRINAISKKYDHVIIDTPPALGFPDACFWAKMGDGVVLVSFAGQTTTPDLKEAKERLTQSGAKVLGTVLSSVQAGHGYYRQGQGYYTQSVQSRESARQHRRKLMFSMEEGSTTTDVSQETGQNGPSDDIFS